MNRYVNAIIGVCLCGCVAAAFGYEKWYPMNIVEQAKKETIDNWCRGKPMNKKVCIFYVTLWSPKGRIRFVWEKSGQNAVRCRCKFLKTEEQRIGEQCKLSYKHKAAYNACITGMLITGHVVAGRMYKRTKQMKTERECNELQREWDQAYSQ